MSTPLYGARSFLDIPRAARRSPKMISAELPWLTRILLNSNFAITAWIMRGIYLFGFPSTRSLSSKVRGGRWEMISVDEDLVLLIISCHFLFIVFLVSPPSTGYSPKITISTSRLTTFGASSSGSKSLSPFFETFSMSLTTSFPFLGDRVRARCQFFLTY